VKSEDSRASELRNQIKVGSRGSTVEFAKKKPATTNFFVNIIVILI
jgi:hypothetical protein